MFKIVPEFLSLSLFFWIFVSSFFPGWMFLSSFWSTPLIWVPVSFPSLLVPCMFSFISLFPLICNQIQPILWASWLPVFWTVHLIGWLSLHCLVVYFLGLWSVISFGPFFCLGTPVMQGGGALGVHQSREPMSLRCDTVCGGGVQEGTVPFAQLLVGFQSLPPLPTSKLGPSGVDYWVGGFVYILGTCGSLQWTLLCGWKFLLLP